jgi:hypothetical protein
MSFHVVRFDDVKATRWKNGGGVTRELLVWPTADEWLVRISVADIEKNGPFSVFPGIQRTITVLNGAGIRLDHPLNVELRPDDPPFTFPGDIAPDCELVQGPTRDLNAMFRNADGVGQLEHWRAGDERKPGGSGFAPGATPPALMGVFTLTAATLVTRGDELEMAPMSLAWTTELTSFFELSSCPQAWIFHYTLRQ